LSINGETKLFDCHQHIAGTNKKILISFDVMGKRRWTTTDQRRWLEERIPAFVKAQDDKTTSSIFFPETHKAWQEEWPVESPTEQEIKDTKGDEAKALAIKTKAIEDVRVHRRHYSAIT
jgi:hypothetical protein